MPQADRGEGALDGVGRPQVPPVLGGEVVEGQEDVPVLREAAACGLVLGTVLLQEVVEGLNSSRCKGLVAYHLRLKKAEGLRGGSCIAVIGLRLPQETLSDRRREVFVMSDAPSPLPGGPIRQKHTLSLFGAVVLVSKRRSEVLRHW